jgi:[acyl-carrier-protein] S-malonyltransferase
LTTAFVFPGQGSQSVGMQKALSDVYDVVRTTYLEASEILGYDLWKVVQEGPAERLNDTVVTQPAMLSAGVAAWRTWQAAGGKLPTIVAGHSLGEITALVCASSLDFGDAVALVQRRSQLMRDAVPDGSGVMAAVMGLDDETILDVCEGASVIGTAEAVNFNSPGQVVVAGHHSALLRLIELAKEAGARRAIMLPVSVPSHSSLMFPAGVALAETLATIKFHEPKVKVVHSVDASPYTTAEGIPGNLSRQVYSPVRWVDTVEFMVNAGATSFVECGPGKVLAGLNKRIVRSVPIGYIDTPESLQTALAQQQ